MREAKDTDQEEAEDTSFGPSAIQCSAKAREAFLSQLTGCDKNGDGCGERIEGEGTRTVSSVELAICEKEVWQVSVD